MTQRKKALEEFLLGNKKIDYLGNIYECIDILSSGEIMLSQTSNGDCIIVTEEELVSNKKFVFCDDSEITR